MDKNPQPQSIARSYRYAWWLALAAVAACGAATHAEPPVYGFRVVNRYAHDPNAFTQGLVINGGRLFESTGLYGRSSVREVELATGNVLRTVQSPAEVFGEGLAHWNNTLIQLTWQNRVAFVFDQASFQFKKQHRYNTEGWGLTQDGQHLIMSDGSASLFFLDPETFSVVRTLGVTSAGIPVARLNELEYINGQIYANVWQTARIAIINPSSGLVTGWIDLAGLAKQHASSPDQVLNGIAHDTVDNRLYVTGKLWNALYEIEVVTGTP